MAYTNRFTEVCQPLAVIHSSNADGAQTSSYVSLAQFHRAVAILDVGAMNQTLDFEILQATDTSGTSSKGIPSTASPEKKITQLTGGDDDNTLYAIELQTEELDVDNGFDCVAIKVTAGGASVQCSAWLFGIEPRYPDVPVTGWGEVIG